MPFRIAYFTVLLLAISTVSASADEIVKTNPQHIEFFEARIRPLLVERCYECHSSDSKSLKAGLKLDSKTAILKGGDSGPAIVAGEPNKSLLIESVRYESNEMPPGGKLSDAQIADLTKWVEIGAPWPAEAPTATKHEEDYNWNKAREHWAFQPIRTIEPPPSRTGDRIGNPIDQFVVAGLRDAKLSQPQPATAPIFVRRVFIDLIGLPPTPDELKHWVGRLTAETDNRNSTRQRVSTDSNTEPTRLPVELVLSDDAVAELIDSLLDRPQYGERWGRHWLDVARYSDVGGWTQDNRPHPNSWQYRDWVVNAFNADMPYDEFVRRQIAGDAIALETNDRSAAVGTGFFALGPTYSSDGGDPESIAQAKSETLDDRVDTFSRAFLGLTVACARCHDHKFDPIPTQDYYSIAGIFNNTREGETPLVDDATVQAYHEARKPIDELNQKITRSRQQASREKRPVAAEEQTQIKAWQAEIKELEAQSPRKFAFAHTILDIASNDMHVALRGNILKPGPIAPRRFLRIVAGEQRAHFSEGSGRKQLASTVTNPSNPLTARVIVNRIWLNHFGKALVRTPNNFGALGEKPTHPELLDWLASTFIESGWSIKSLHRLITTSATYRSSSNFNETAFAFDGDNRTIWRMNPRRMDAETWRDSLLAVTGELDITLGGASIEDIVNSNRRTLYAKVSRNDPLASDEFLRLFDFPIPRASSAKRTANIVPQQYLFMMNSPFMLDRAKALSARLLKESEQRSIQIELAYELLYSRKPDGRELHSAQRFLGSESESAGELDRWQQYCQVLLSANEFMYVR